MVIKWFIFIDKLRFPQNNLLQINIYGEEKWENYKNPNFWFGRHEMILKVLDWEVMKTEWKEVHMTKLSIYYSFFLKAFANLEAIYIRLRNATELLMTLRHLKLWYRNIGKNKFWKASWLRTKCCNQIHLADKIICQVYSHCTYMYVCIYTHENTYFRREIKNKPSFTKTE